MKSTEGEGKREPRPYTGGPFSFKEHKGAFTALAIILALIVVGVLYSQV